MSWHTLLVLGGIGSGGREFAESLLTDPVLRVRAEAGVIAEPARLASLLAEAKPDQTLLVEDLMEWAAGDPGPLPEAIRACPARVVLVSTEAGLAGPAPGTTGPAPGTTGPAPGTAGQDRVLALAALNRALADTADAVALVVAGQPLWLKGAAAWSGAGAPARASAAPEPTGDAPAPGALRNLPVPDEDARSGATTQLAGLGTLHLGALESVVTFAAATQGRAQPAPWQRIRVLVLHGDHPGQAAVGARGSAGLAAQLREGSSPLARLAGAAGASVQTAEVPAAAPIEAGAAMTEEAVEEFLGYGWRLASQAVDEGVDALVLGSIGDGADTAAAAMVAVLATNAEPAAMLPRIRSADGRIDDRAWIARCAAVRDAVHRARTAGRTGARPVLAELGGPDLATATGLILGAAARRTPVLLDGPVGASAALAARGLAAQARHWCLLLDHNQHPVTMRAADTLGLIPLFDLQLDLGEGAPALAALPLLRTALMLAATATATTALAATPATALAATPAA